MKNKKLPSFGVAEFNKTNLQLLRLLVEQELTLRYKRSVLGIAWTFLNPMLTSFILWVVFSYFFVNKLQTGQQFAPYLMAGILLNTFFTQGLLNSANSIAVNSNILTKVAVAPKIFAFAASLSAFVNFLISLIPLTIVVYISGQSINFAAPLVIVLGLLLALFAAGLGLALSILFIRFEDAKNITNILLLMTLYLTPIFYPISILSESMQRIVSLNPLTSFLEIFRWSFSNNSDANLNDFVYILISSIIFFMFGNFIFKRNWPRIVTML
jgi:ABC-type polysaccharide/polyol phosphate export permease